MNYNWLQEKIKKMPKAEFDKFIFIMMMGAIIVAISLNII